MANPQFLLLDSDVLIQCFIADELRPLRELKKGYGIQPAIVPEVETEIAWTRNYKDRFDPSLRKAIGNGTVVILDEWTFPTHVGTTILGAAAAGASYASIQRLGMHYNQRVQTGEAYTFATAVSIRQPAASNDWKAIKTLQEASLDLPSPVLRAYDLIVFAFLVGSLDDPDCERFREALLREKSEFIPQAFRANSFQDGLRNFTPRLLDATLALSEVNQAGGTTPSYAVPLSIARQ